MAWSEKPEASPATVCTQAMRQRRIGGRIDGICENTSETELEPEEVEEGIELKKEGRRLNAKTRRRIRLSRLGGRR